MHVVFALSCAAQEGITNFGNMIINPGTTMSATANFINNATGSLTYENDGLFFVGGDFINNQPAMPQGGGTTEFNGTATQNIDGTAIPQFNNIRISNNGGSGMQPLINIKVAGAWDNNGIFSHNLHEVIFNGGFQTIGGTNAITFYDFTLTNTAPNAFLTLATPTNLLNIFAFKNINAGTLESFGNLTVRSSLTATAQIADITQNGTLTGNSITGNVTVERHIPAGRKWRFLAVNTAAGTGSKITVQGKLDGRANARHCGTVRLRPLGYRCCAGNRI